MLFKVSHRVSSNLLRRVCSELKLSSSNSYSTKESSEPDLETLLHEATRFDDAENKDWSTSPYPDTSGYKKEKKNKTPLIDPADTSVLIFPGQGTLKVGKIREYLKYPRVKDMFEIANEALGYDILKICEFGPQKLLNRTEYNQPATVLTSLAAVEKLQEERPLAIDNCVNVAGYSVGEIAALIFAGAINFESGIRLVGVRAAAMQQASELQPQGMISVFCTPEARTGEITMEAEKWARDLGVQVPVCRTAIYLCCQTKIIAGNEEALSFIEKNGRNYGLRQIKRLPVSGAFHTPLMAPAAAPFKEALNSITVHEPTIPVYSNVTGERHKNDPEYIKKFLVKQLCRPVRWEQLIQRIYIREPGIAYPRTFDVGSSGTMRTILKQIHAKATDKAISI